MDNLCELSIDLCVDWCIIRSSRKEHQKGVRYKDMKKISYYGKSMYGGWYANYFDESTGHYNGEHANTFKELSDKIGMTAKEIKESGCRFDN